MRFEDDFLDQAEEPDCVTGPAAGAGRTQRQRTDKTDRQLHITSPRHRITLHHITKSPNHYITKSPHHQITKSPDHQITHLSTASLPQP